MQLSSSKQVRPRLVDVHDELRTRILWVTVFRTVASSLLLVTIVLRIATSPQPDISPEDALFFGAVGGVYALTLVYGLLLRRQRIGPTTAYLQVLGDVAFASVLVFLTGGVESPFTFTYLVAVVVGAILLFGRGALLGALFSSFSLALLGFGIRWGWIPPPSNQQTLELPRLVYFLSSNVLAQFLIAALAGYLSRQLRSAGGMLTASQSDLQALSRLQQQILAHMPSGLVTCDALGKVSYVNRSAEVILGQRAEQLVGTALADLFPGVQRLEPFRRSELPVITALGPKTLGLTSSPLHEEGSGALLVVFQDLTDLRRMEDELRRVDRLASLGRLAAQLAHEIRNPLAAMRGCAQMLAQGSEEAEGAGARKRLSGILVREGDRLSKLVEDFLRFARPPPPELRQVAVAELVRETVEMLEADPMSHGIRLETTFHPAFALADPDQLRQALINVVRNALMAAAPEGRVRVTVEESGGQPTIRVWDSAGSIPPENLERIFEPFFTTRTSGTGLGLSTAHSIVRANGGNIHVTSSRETGTEFTLMLARSDEGPLARLGG